MVKQYTCTCTCEDEDDCMVPSHPDNGGSWVRYSDYAALEAQLKPLKQFDLVRFASEKDGGPVHRIVSVMRDGMVELHDMGGYFAPHLFVVADDIAGMPPRDLSAPEAEHRPRRKNADVRFAISWLHRRAEQMNDPKAKQILNSAAFDLGQEQSAPEAQQESVAHAYVVNGECEQIEWGMDVDLPNDPSLVLLYTRPAQQAVTEAMVERMCRTPFIESFTPTNEEWAQCEAIQDQYDLMKRRIREGMAALKAAMEAVG